MRTRVQFSVVGIRNSKSIALMKTNRSQRHRINYSSHDADVSVYINIRQTNENSPYSNLNHKTFFGIFGFGLRLEYGTPSLKSRLIESKCYQVNENVSHASACARFMKQTMWSLSLDFLKILLLLPLSLSSFLFLFLLRDASSQILNQKPPYRNSQHPVYRVHTFTTIYRPVYIYTYSPNKSTRLTR